MMLSFKKQLPLIAGICLFPLGLFLCDVSSSIKSPRPIPPPDIQWPDLASNAINDWPEFSQRLNIPSDIEPEWCILTDHSTIIETIKETRCYHYIQQEKGSRMYKVTSYSYNSEGEQLYKSNHSYPEPYYVYLSEYDAGKYRRFFGEEELLPAEREVNSIIFSTIALGFLLTTLGLLLITLGVLNILNTRHSEPR